MAQLELISNLFLDNILLALALGALVGLERERVPSKKYAGVRTLSLFCAGGPLAVMIASPDLTGSALPIMIYLVLGAVFSLLVIYIRSTMEDGDLGLTTSSTVFLMGLVGVLVGYDKHFEAVSVTLLAVLMLSEKKVFTRYTELLSPQEISDAVKLGILALVLYPILPEGAVDPYGVLFLRKALLFVIFILLIQFAAYISLRWLRTRISFLMSSLLGGLVSSLAVVTAMAEFVRDNKLESSAYLASVLAVVAMLLRNGFVAVTLAPALLEPLLLPFVGAMMIGIIFTLVYLYRFDGKDAEDVDFGTYSPFSFKAAFKFGVYFLAILMVSEVAQAQFADLGFYAVAFLGGAASSTAVVASAVTLLESSTQITLQQAATMIVLGAISSLLSKLVYVELGGARKLTLRLIAPYLLMCIALLAVLL